MTQFSCIDEKYPILMLFKSPRMTEPCITEACNRDHVKPPRCNTKNIMADSQD